MKHILTIVAAGLGLFASACTMSPRVEVADQGGGKEVRRFFVIMMENTSYQELIKNPNAPWINAAAEKYGAATQYYGVSHPSQPNYIAATSGSTNGVIDDSEVTLDVRNLADQLEGAKKTWKSYQQSLALCGGNKLAFTCGDHRYERKHNPFASYLNVQTNPDRVAKIVDLSELDADLASGAAPDFSWITPDQCHDMHGHPGPDSDPCSYANRSLLVAAGDSFLKSWIEKIMASKVWSGNAVIIITWDESDHPGSPRGCCSADPGGGEVMTIVISHAHPAARSSKVAYNHYSLLATIQAAWDLGCLANSCNRDVTPMSDLVDLH